VSARHDAEAMVSELAPAIALRLGPGEHPRVRSAAALALGWLPIEELIDYAPSLVELLHARDPDVRRCALSALGELSPTAQDSFELEDAYIDKVEELSKKDDDLFVRYAASEVLGVAGGSLCWHALPEAEAAQSESMDESMDESDEEASHVVGVECSAAAVPVTTEEMARDALTDARSVVENAKEAFANSFLTDEMS